MNVFLARESERSFSELLNGNTPNLLSMIFSRLYILRNQLVHGGATWNGKENRAQIRDCSRFLGKLVPVIVSLMMDNPDVDWGDIVYPVIGKTS
ncbi:MAG: hypothetical protein D8M52_07050 [Chlorobi bacterium]|nr:MAG: hypothetical protein F9K28_06305 [Bacteroidota bacterium]KXK35920.1 MAG: hypothetical protein UZ06_CHB003000108 [Chlorobi bacterium OLB6]MBL1161460.1 hypothetical protein [Chlorobiota bacterium]MBW7853982.1 hypothetical protein [Candidatus Kapabacteria bacterium]MCC6331867.1 hypothetical protein [Ignavibacteria bacterium]